MLACLVSIWFSFFPPPIRDCVSVSPPDSYLIIHGIRIEGNRKTRPALIMRELDITPGDTLPGTLINDALKRNKNKIFNTNLFNSVELVLLPNEYGNIDLVIQVTERWYVFPIVIFELGDRNFNEWWNERGRDLRRTNYGLRVAHKNMFGRGDQLQATAQFGFTRRFDLGYDFRYLDKAQKNGLALAVSYATNNNVAYRTENNKLRFLNASDLLRERFYASVRFTRRNRFYNQHRVEGRFHYNRISDTIARLNPGYFLDGRTRQQYGYLSYEFVHDRRDQMAYPLRGRYAAAEVERLGLLPGDGVGKTIVRANFALFGQVGKKYFWNFNVRAMATSPARQPYNEYRALGFGLEYLRGYENYLIDGQHFALLKTTFKRELFSAEFALPQLVPLRQFQTVPVAVYVCVFSDYGYVYDPMRNPGNSRLANTWLFSTGAGVDVVTFYNVVLRLNYAVNRQGDRGVFFNFASDI